MKKLYLFIVITTLFWLENNIFAQDSLYLITTFVGEENDNIAPNFLVHSPYSIGMGDLNNDGINDLIIHSSTGAYFKLYFGNTTWYENNSLVYRVSQHYFPQGYSNVIGIGDINGDGYDDFAIDGTRDPIYYEGKVLLYLGGDSINMIPVFSFNKQYIWDFLSFGSSGDFNNDGFQDFLIRNLYAREQENGECYLFKGGVTISENPFKIFYGRSNLGYFSESSIFADINGDGFDDILITESFAVATYPQLPKLYIFYGGEEIKDTADVVFDIDIQPTIYDLHDVNNDGYDDFMLMTSLSYPKLYLGGSFFNPDSFIGFSNYDNILDFGYGIGYLGDINNDGYDDFGINIQNFQNTNGEMVGKLNIYLGGKEIDTIPDYTLIGETHHGGYGSYLGALGDINGDGYNEFFVSAFPVDNKIAKIYIYSMKKFVVDVEEEKANIPSNFVLYQNYPNPFNPSTTIKYSVPGNEKRETKNVKLTVYDVLGNEVATLVNEQKPAGNYEVKFDGSHLSSGIYFYQLKYSEFTETKKMLLIK